MKFYLFTRCDFLTFVFMLLNDPKIRVLIMQNSMDTDNRMNACCVFVIGLKNIGQ